MTLVTHENLVNNFRIDGWTYFKVHKFDSYSIFIWIYLQVTFLVEHLILVRGTYYI